MNLELCTEMEKNVREQLLSVVDPSTCVSGIAHSFLKLADHLQVYSMYFNGNDASLQALEALKKSNPSFSKFLEVRS